MKRVHLGLTSGGGGMLCAYVLQCGSEQRINDYGLCAPCLCVFIFPRIGHSVALVCIAIVSFFSA